MNHIATLTESEKRHLNQSIFAVCTHKYKKECPADHEYVESCGYKIWKYDGNFYVGKQGSWRSIQIDPKCDWRTNRDYYRVYLHGHYGKSIEKPVIDFVNYLETTRKPYDPLSYSHDSAQDKLCRLHRKKYDIDCNKKHLAETQEKIKKLQDELIYYAQRVTEAENEYKALRKKYGLK